MNNEDIIPVYSFDEWTAQCKAKGLQVHNHGLLNSKYTGIASLWYTATDSAGLHGEYIVFCNRPDIRDSGYFFTNPVPVT
jgi:hypothetical protein